MQTLTAENLTKIYGEKTLFDHISFLIKEGDRIGLIGTNGAGKTTLLNTLTGKDALDAGTIKTPKNYRISYLQQIPQLPQQLTILEAIFTGDNPLFKVIKAYEHALAELTQNSTSEKAQTQYAKAESAMNQADAWNTDTQIKAILTQLNITNLNRQVKQLSGGQQKRVGLAQVLIAAPDLLILDEPTNHLDFASIAWLEKYLANYKGALLIVTHDRYFLDRVANQIYELALGKLTAYPGNFEAYLKQSAEATQQAQEQAAKQEKQYKKELSWMRTGAKARSTKQQARINRFNQLKDQLNQKETPDEDLDISLGQKRLGKKVMTLKHATLTFHQHPIIKDLDLLIQSHARLGITGANGAGKTTFLNVLAGKQPLDSGTYTLGETVRLGYYTQLMAPLDPNKRVISYLQEVGDTVTDKSGTVISVTQLLEQFLFPRFMHGALIRKLSGGERRRLYLLKVLMAQPNVLLLDEPTNNLDISTLTVLENYLQNFNGAVITVSHDRYFLDQVAQQLLVFHGGARVTRFTGALSEYLAQQNNIKTTKKTPQPKPAKPKPHTTAKKTKLTYNEQKEWQTIETKIDSLEQKLAAVQKEMQANGSDYGKLAEQQKEVDRLNQSIETKMKRWDYLSQFVD
ncbi:ABC-F family ATP-binding cassette domain-containing protein [Loigolactobacillus rennini]|uniref:ABC transporter n=1 Tax=Loigolactobacillus rennini DSM 20253 TaxID=1423796 RepID=A0A0R2D5G9_9LACO|nr:ABC-F family ATP-binding cassette domain-containing protein [Loigolactobacillus rennini]KRM98917.1 ABC transporter [Loigolactobacillus rennini DSM 20253]